MTLFALSFLSSGITISMLCAVAGLVFAFFLILAVSKASPGNARMQEIAAAIQEGAKAYLNRQVITISAIAAVIFVLLFLFMKDGAGATAVGFLIGAFCSLVAGYIGMRIAVLANVRTTQAASSSRTKALRVAFNGGAVTGLLVVGLALLSVGIFYTIAGKMIGHELAIRSLIGLALGASLISVFARLGGGIYTKAADVGADLVGKIENTLEEDDPRNPATIADNVGDNVGDCAGMAADVFETYAVSLIGAILIGSLTIANEPAAVIYPFVLGGISVLGAIIGILFVNLTSLKPGSALMGAVGASALVSAILFWPATHMMFPNGLTISGVERSSTSLYFAALVGLAADRHRGLDHELLHFHRLPAGAEDRQSLRDWPRHQHHRRSRHRAARHRAPGRVHWSFDSLQLSLRRPLRHRHRRHEHALHGRHHHLARRLRPDHG